MNAKILDKQYSTVPVHETYYANVNGETVDVSDLSPEDLKKKLITKELQREHKNVSVNRVTLKVLFSEGDFQEEYTFHVNESNPNDPLETIENFDQRVSDRIKEEIAIYSQRSQTDTAVSDTISLNKGDVIEG